MASIIDDIRDYIRAAVTDSSGDYEVDEYVLERREPDQNPRVTSYDELVSSSDVETDADLPPGTYALREIKSSGMAGDVVWQAELAPKTEP